MLQSIPRSKLIELIRDSQILFFTLSEFRSDETRGAHGHVSEIWPFYEQISYRRIAMPVRSDETRGALGHVLEISPFYEQISYRRIAMPVSTLLLATFIWWIIPGLLVKSGKKWDCTGTLPGLLVFYRGGDLAGNTAKLHQASTGTLPGLSGKVLAIYQDFTVITRYGNSIITDGFL
ncbi:hypothetical protein JOM56_012027 [Amanita muscaria]